MDKFSSKPTTTILSLPRPAPGHPSTGVSGILCFFGVALANATIQYMMEKHSHIHPTQELKMTARK